MAKKSGQMAIFENKSGQRKMGKILEKCWKMARKWLKRDFYGRFLGNFDGNFISWPKAHFYSLFIAKIKILILYK